MKNKPRANADILFWMKNDSLKAEVHGSGHTDEQGNFYCILPDSVDITGKWSLTLSVSNEGKQRHSQILINRHFSPEKRSYTFFDTYVNDSVAPLEADTLGKINMAETQMLQEVEVKKYLPRPIMQPDMEFDAEEDINRMLDKGGYFPSTVQEYAKYKYPILENSNSSTLIIYLLSCRKEDVAKFKHIPVADMDITNVKSLQLHTRNGVEILNRLSYCNPDASYLIDAIMDMKCRYFIVVAELYDEVYNDSRKGMRQTFYEGYSPVKECYNLKSTEEALGSLNYRRTLYWNPDVRTDAEGKANIRLFNNGTCRKMEISAEGCDSGTPVISSDVPSTH